MSYSFFYDKAYQPSLDEIESILGSALEMWRSLAGFLSEKTGARPEFKFYGKNYGWMLSYKKGGKALAALYPRQNGMVVQIILSPAQVEVALGFALSPGLRNAILSATPYTEGRWVFFPLETQDDLQIVQELIAIKTCKK